MTSTKKSASDELAELIQAHEDHLASVKLAAAKSGSAGYTLELTLPIRVGAETVSKLHFRPQTVRDVQDAKDEGMASMMAALAGVKADEINQLCTSDFDAAIMVLEGFNLRRAAGGPARSSSK